MPLINLHVYQVEFELYIALDSVHDCRVSEAAFESLRSSVTIPKYVFFLTHQRLYQKTIYKIKILQRKELNLSQLGNKN